MVRRLHRQISGNWMVGLDLEFFLCALAREECGAREERRFPRMGEIGCCQSVWLFSFCKAVLWQRQRRKCRSIDGTGNVG